MAQSANGYIALPDDETPWTDSEWAEYEKKVQEVGNIIIGRRTYDRLTPEGFISIGSPDVVVVTTKDLTPKFPKTHAAHSIEDACAHLSSKGYNECFIGGGSQLNKSALEADLIDEIFLDIEPKIFGKGLPLFAESDINLDLELITIRQTGQNTMQLHWRVLHK